MYKLLDVYLSMNKVQLYYTWMMSFITLYTGTRTIGVPAGVHECTREDRKKSRPAAAVHHGRRASQLPCTGHCIVFNPRAHRSAGAGVRVLGQCTAIRAWFL